MRSLALVALLATATACGGAQAPAEATGDDLELDEIYEERVAESRQYPVPEPATASSGRTVDLPRVPAFPPPPAGDVLPVVELLRRRNLYLDREVSIEGVVVWRRDCVDARARQGVPRSETARMVRSQSAGCEAGQLFVGSREDAEPDETLWIVDAPVVLDVAVGERIVVRGAFRQRAGSRAHAGGLLIWAGLGPAS